jgi:glutathione S-transferase
MFGQLGAFAREAARDEHAFAKFHDEARRLAGVLAGRLRGREWIAREYSIADIINYPWFSAVDELQPDVLDGADAVKDWMARMAAPRRQAGDGTRPRREVTTRAEPRGSRFRRRGRAEELGVQDGEGREGHHSGRDFDVIP